MSPFAFVQRRLAPETRRLTPDDRGRLFLWVQRNIKIPTRMFVVLGIALAISCSAAWPISQWLSRRWPSSPWAAVAIPLTCFAPMGVFFFFALRERRRWVRRGMNALGYPTCVRCGYDLTGIDEERCPECGTQREDHPVTSAGESP